MWNTRLAVQAAIGIVTRIGGNGWPYGPAIRDTGCLACCCGSIMDASYLTNKCWSNLGGPSRIPARLLSPDFQPMTVRVTVDSVSSDPQALSAVAVLADDLRRRMYEF